MYKAVIVDDESKARNNLIQLLQKHSDLLIVGEASNYDEAIQIITEKMPDLIFLDIKMPQHSGFDVLDKLIQLDIRNFDVVFLTAYDEYAIKAIKYAAFDYLLKPIDEEELHETLIKFKAKKRNKHFLNIEALRSMLDPCKRLKINTKTGYEFISHTEITYFEGDSNYTKMVLADGNSYNICRTLKDIENELIASTFVRVHKAFIINKQYLSAYNKEEKKCVLKTPTHFFEIPVSIRLVKNLII